MAEHQKYDNAEIVWAQEEPMNMGYWTYVSPRLVTAVGIKPKIRCVCVSVNRRLIIFVCGWSVLLNGCINPPRKWRQQI